MVTIGRRAFLSQAGAVCVVPALWAAREMVQRGGLGRVVFCRASRMREGWLRFLLDGNTPVCERVDRDELVLCGTEATLVIDRHGCRRFA
jgi:hypothetical protein